MGSPVPTEFLNLINAVGSDFRLSQGFGGNCSVKFGEEMLVKASGKRMRNVEHADFFHRVRLTGGGGFVDDIETQGARASIEVAMHAQLPSRYVLHIHSTHAILALADVNSQFDWVVKHRGYEILNYVRPGASLARAISDVVSKGPPTALLLKNHGLVLASDSLKEISESLNYLESKFGRDSQSENRLDKIVEMLIQQDHSNWEKVIWHAKLNWRITPDHIVFMGVRPGPDFSSVAAVKRLITRIHEKLSENTPLDVIEEQAVWFVMFAITAPKKHLSTIAMEEAISLANWEAEKYRLQLAATGKLGPAQS